MSEDQLVVAFDADDTLWDNESTFADGEAFFRSIAEPWADGPRADAHLLDVERRNIHRYGYGARSFGLSMIEAILELSDNTVSAAVIGRVIGKMQELLDHEPVPLVGAAETVQQLAAERRVLIITKGDLLNQQQRLRASGLDAVVEVVEIVAEKNPETYAAIASQHRIDPSTLVMVGNSLKSDVAPVVAMGGRAIHIPFHVTWALEQDHGTLPDHGWVTAAAITEVPGIIAEWEQAGAALSEPN